MTDLRGFASRESLLKAERDYWRNEWTAAERRRRAARSAARGWAWIATVGWILLFGAVATGCAPGAAEALRVPRDVVQPAQIQPDEPARSVPDLLDDEHSS